MPIKARIYIGIVATLGLAILGSGFYRWESQDWIRFSCCLLIAILGSALKVPLPTISGTMSVNFLFILIGIIELGFPETLAVGCAGTLVQCFWKPKVRPKPIQVVFNTASMAIAVTIPYYIYHSRLAAVLDDSTPLLLMLAASVFFVLNTLPIAAVIALTEVRSLAQIWHDCYSWCFPYYLVGASLGWVFSAVNGQIRWQTSLFFLPVLYFIYRSYRLYLGRLEDEKKHVEEMARLHLRTIEALALAIQAKDHTTHDRLCRVRTYALEIGRELGLSQPELEGLRAAALLHDIGKLAVPEHIISKPGKLSAEEFEKLKTHPVVGAEILEEVQFPYPVVPIVRAHHEKWDGTGYPAGLEGEGIPIGARILAVVDALDALASDRQYRRALPLDQAMKIIASESGKSFDPKVVEIVQSRYVELERLTQAEPLEPARLSMDLKIHRGEAPAAGFETSRKGSLTESADFLSSIAAARQEVQMLFEMTQDLGNSLSLNETLSVVAVRLKRLILYDSVVVYVLRDQTLVPEYVNGENFRLFSSLRIPLGEGLCGWVAEKKKPILNGNPSVEAGYLNDPNHSTPLRSALAVPLEGPNGTVGVLALYRSERNAFFKDNLRILLAISSKVSLSIENALKYRQVEDSATTDFLTSLPNARSLFLRLDSELARCRRVNIPLAVLVCDLDGFKQVNDRFGHLEGNRILRHVADGLKKHCREYDSVARMGGDEFVLILPGVDREAVEEKIAALRQVASRAGALLPGRAFLSLSVGAAFYPADGAEAEGLLAEADRRMYKAKQLEKLKQRNALRLLPQTAREVAAIH